MRPDLNQARIRAAYDDLSETHPKIKSAEFSALVEAIGFYSAGINVKLVNGQTDEDVAVRSPYNLFVGGNKLGRGVTIKNLLVSYYGRNPRSPQADTVLQHARMYGYRRGDLGLLRLYLPHELHTVFRAISKMERGLRDLIARKQDEVFRGIYLEGGLHPTRRNVLAPGSIGVYTGGSIYNPAQILRDDSVAEATRKIDDLVKEIRDKDHRAVPLELLAKVIITTIPDDDRSERIWDQTAIAESLVQYGKLSEKSTGYIYVDRDRRLKENRRETQGILTSGEASAVPADRVTLFMLRTAIEGRGQAAWWPQIRFPVGRYAFAFAI